MEFLSNAQFWLVLGVVFLIAEIFTVSFFAIFLGLAAIIVSFTTWLGLTGSLASQLISFSVLSVLSLAFFRKYAIGMFGKNDKPDRYEEFVGDKAKVSVKIPVHGEGKIFYRGADWAAESADNQTLEKGTVVIIKKRVGMKLVVAAAE